MKKLRRARNCNRFPAISESLERRTLLTAYTASTAFEYPDSSVAVSSAVFKNSDGGFTGVGGEEIYQFAPGSTAPTALATFTFGTTDAYEPTGTVVQDSAGDLFGSSESGGTNHDGAIWEWQNGSNTIITLASFDSDTTGAESSGVFMDASGNLYGVTQSGGANGIGAVWTLTKSTGVLSAVPLTTDVGTDNAGVVADAAGDIFGATVFSGSPSTNPGVFFEISAGQTSITSLADFKTGGGDALAIDSTGNVFGLTTQTASPNSIFEDAAADRGTIRTVTSGIPSAAQLAMDANGDLFTTGIPAAGESAIYEATPIAASTVARKIATLDATAEGNNVFSLQVDPSTGIVYGNTNNGGTTGNGAIFELTPQAAPPAGTLSVAVSKLTLPASVVSGAAAKAAVTVSVSNSSGTIVSGPVSAKLFLSANPTIDSNSIALSGVVSKKLTLKNGKATAFNFHVKSIPAGTAAGQYYLVSQVSDPNGNLVDAAASRLVTVVPAQIDLTSAFIKATPKVKPGKTLAVTFTLTNRGTVAAKGILPVGLVLSGDSVGLPLVDKHINLAPGKAIRLTVQTKAPDVPAGNYFIQGLIDPNNTFNDISPSNNDFGSTTPVLTIT